MGTGYPSHLIGVSVRFDTAHSKGPWALPPRMIGSLTTAWYYEVNILLYI